MTAGLMTRTIGPTSRRSGRSSPRSTSRRRTGRFRLRSRPTRPRSSYPPYYPDHPVTRRDWAEYLDAASELDRKIGLILRQLEADGLAEQHNRCVLGRPRPVPCARQAVLLRGGAAHPTHHPLAGRMPDAPAFPAGHRGRSFDGGNRPRADFSGDRRRAQAEDDARPRSSWATMRDHRVTTPSALATAATRPSFASAPCATPVTATSATSRPSGRFSSPTTTRSTAIRSGTCSRSSTPRGS